MGGTRRKEERGGVSSRWENMSESVRKGVKKGSQEGKKSDSRKTNEWRKERPTARLRVLKKRHLD